MAFVSSSLGFGGATTFLFNLCRGLKKRGVPVVVLSLEREHAFQSDFEEAGIPTFIQDETKDIYEDRLSNTLRRLAEFEPSAVVANLGHSSYEVLRYVPVNVRRLGIVHADHAIFYGVATQYAKYLDVVVGVSEEIRCKLSAFPELAHAEAHFLTSGVPIPPVLQRGATPVDAPLRILYIGRLERPQKRVHLFPEILRGLVQSGIPFQWTIVGEGAERQWLKEQLLTSRSDQLVTVQGPVPNSEIEPLLQEHDILLLASDCEGLPISLLEAMAAGLVPVVTKLDSGVADLAGADCGVLVQEDDVLGYSRAIILLHNDRKTLRNFSINAHQKVLADYSSEAMSEKWLSSLRSEAIAQSWPSSWHIRTPCFAGQRLYFSRVARPIRRLLKRYSSA